DYIDEVAEDWPDLLEIVRRLVKPERDKQKRQALRERWWQYAEKRPGLYKAIAGLPRVLATLRVKEDHALTFIPAPAVFANTLYVFSFVEASALALLQSRIHELWVRKFSSTLEDRATYSSTDCFEPFPCPVASQTSVPLNDAGQLYFDHRAAL